MAKSKKAQAEMDLEAQIAEWKSKYGGVYALPVEDKTAYLREPSMLDYKRAFKEFPNGEVAFQEEMLKILRIGGDDEIFSDDAYFLSARKKVAKLLEYPDAQINKLDDGTNEIIIEGNRCVVRKVTRDDLKLAALANPGSKAFVTQEKLFERIVKEQDEAFNDRNVASIRFPLYEAIEKLQNQKIAVLKKL